MIRAFLFLNMENHPTTPENHSSTPQIVDHFFRHEYGKLISLFTSKYGSRFVEIIEDSVQDALIKAMQVWPYYDIPKNPSAWIFRAANNNLIDRLRREKKIDRSIVPEDVLSDQSIEMKFPEEQVFEDDQLKLMFSCCHPSLPQETQIILTLNLLCGFGAHEIARALLKNKEAIAKALTRGKTRFKNEIGTLELPTENELRSRLQVVLKVVYLLFNEGYKVTRGEKLIDDSLTSEAIRLGNLLVSRYNNQKDLQALLALMYFQVSRFKARTDSLGDLIPMEKQDRTLWDINLITIGNQYLEASSDSDSLSEYHIQAAIAAIHCNATTFAGTDWKQMLTLYDLQVSNNRLPIAELNRVVPLTRVHGAEVGLKELERLSKYPKLLVHHLYYAIKAEILTALERNEEGILALERALDLVTNDSEKRFLQKKLDRLTNR